VTGQTYSGLQVLCQPAAAGRFGEQSWWPPNHVVRAVRLHRPVHLVAAARELTRWLLPIKWLLAIPHHIEFFACDLGTRGRARATITRRLGTVARSCR
jgi:hypothetical protein